MNDSWAFYSFKLIYKLACLKVHADDRHTIVTWGVAEPGALVSRFSHPQGVEARRGRRPEQSISFLGRLTSRASF